MIMERKNNYDLMNETNAEEEGKYLDYTGDNKFVDWLAYVARPEKDFQAKLLIPKWPLLHPNKYDKNWSASRWEIEKEPDGYYTIYVFKQLTQRQGNDKYNIILLDAEDMLIPIRIYMRGGIEVDPAYRTDFNRRFSLKERHFILGCINTNWFPIVLDANEDYTRPTVNTVQRYISHYRDDMSPKRIRTGDIRLYDSKTRRKIKESGGIYTARALKMNENSDTFGRNLEAQYRDIMNNYK